jgi:hypothetical protein
MTNTKGEKLVWGVKGFKARTPKVLRTINMVGMVLTGIMVLVLPAFPEIPVATRDLINRIVVSSGVVFNFVCETFGWAKR